MTDASDSSLIASPRGWLLAVLPLVLLVVSLWGFIRFDPMEHLTGDQPPVEQLSIQQVELTEAGIDLRVVNGGPEPVTVAQVMVDEAYWDFEISPRSTIPRLGEASVFIPFHWVHGAAHEVRLVTSSGLTFERVIDPAVMTPRPTTSRWLLFGLVGLFVGVVPVGIGLMWFPFLKRLSSRAMNFILALTAGLLIFLLVDTGLEGIEIAEQVPEVFQGVPLVVLAGLLAFLGLMLVGRRTSWEEPDGRADPTRAGSAGGGGITRAERLWIATAIAIGIGIHNLGEGLIVGASVATGEAALGSFLVVGFVLHNVTEGVGIGAPVARSRPGWLRLVGLVLVAGLPAVAGIWLGAFQYSPLMAVVFFAIGAGAILQVVVEVGRLLVEDAGSLESAMTSWANVGGLTVGILIMYGTALLV